MWLGFGYMRILIRKINTPSLWEFGNNRIHGMPTPFSFHSHGLARNSKVKYVCTVYTTRLRLHSATTFSFLKPSIYQFVRESVLYGK